MTQESPIQLCYDCRAPLGATPDRVAGELYCENCVGDAVLRHRA